jgi:geranylgeranyl diphosphate synthase, type II
LKVNSSNKEKFLKEYDSYVMEINNALDTLLMYDEEIHKTLFEAIRYSVDAGGKRIRPVLMLAVCDSIGGCREDVLPLACAIEMIHTYSLIHDDLPAMDDDVLRRGKPTSHMVFGEAVAILAGDALLNLASEVMLTHATHMERKTDNITGYIKAMSYILKASGSFGMISGQVIDLKAAGNQKNIDELKKMHRKKTGALIRASIVAPALVLSCDNLKIKYLENFADNLGLAFQIKDDILDVEGSSKKMGKLTGVDQIANKSTFVTMLGIDNSKEILCKTNENALTNLSNLHLENEFLYNFTHFLAEREN